MILSGKRGPSVELIAGLHIYFSDKIFWLLTGKGDRFGKIKDLQEVPKNPDESAAVAAIDESQRVPNTMEPQAKFNLAPGAADLLQKAHAVLKSGNPVAIDAVAHNINYFAYAIESENRHKQMEKRLETLGKAIRAAAVKRIRVGDPPAKKAELVKRRVITAIMKGTGEGIPISPTTPD
jgi:hypothetical protein